MSCTTATWNTWVDNSTSASTSTTSFSTTATWTTWVTAVYDGTSATTSTLDSSGVWITWVGSGGGYDYQPKVESAEEKAARLEREMAERERAAAERERAAAERERKAYAFLLLCLDEKQKKDLAEKKHFELSVVGGRRYRINQGQSRNIQELDKSGKVKRTLCFHPQDNLHHYDAMAIQKLTLECAEEEALKVANFS